MVLQPNLAFSWRLERTAT